MREGIVMIHDNEIEGYWSEELQKTIPYSKIIPYLREGTPVWELAKEMTPRLSTEMPAKSVGVKSTLEDLLKEYQKFKIDVYYSETGCYTYATVESALEDYGKNWYSAFNDWAIFTPLNSEEEETGVMYFLMFADPNNQEEFKRKTTVYMVRGSASLTGKFTIAEFPFQLLPPAHFDKEAFGEDAGYWRADYLIFDNGDVLIKASPAMSYGCVMLARRDGSDGYTLFRRAGYDYMNVEIASENDETEQYIQNVILPNIQRINAIEKWAYVEQKESFLLSLEGASLEYFYSANGLEKITADLFGETYECRIEYYFLDGRLSLIHDITTRYDSDKYDADPDEVMTTTEIERKWYMNGHSCIRGAGENGQKLTPTEIRDEFLETEGNKGVFSLYISILSL
jgi:hypothetical protein